MTGHSGGWFNLEGARVSRDPYAVLGVTPGAPGPVVKAAFRRLAKACHPDRVGADPRAARRFREIAQAYETLSRAGYAEPIEEPRARVRVRAPRRGGDVRAALTVSLEEAVRGGARKIALADGREAVVRLPAALEAGAVLRVKGMGGPGRDGGPDGDVLVAIDIARHPRIRIDGRDAHVLLEASPGQLAAGGQATVESPHGPIALRIPPGARAGQVMRLRAKGLPARGAAPAGDLYVTLKTGEAAEQARAAARHADRWSARPAA